MQEEMIVITTKFEELRKEFNSSISKANRLITPNLDDINSKILVMQNTINNMLILLDEMVRKKEY